MAPALGVTLCLLLPLAGVPLVVLFRARPNLREAVSITIGLGLVFLCLRQLVTPAPSLEAQAIVALPIGDMLALAFSLEPLGMCFALLASALFVVNTLYSIGYMRANGEKNQTLFYASFLVAISATMGVAFADNLFTLFVFYEILTLSTYPLVTHKRTAEAIGGGRVYAGILLGGSICLFLPALVWVYAATGTTDFVPGGILKDFAVFSPGALLALMTLFCLGIAKGALFPMHNWLPRAMVAPTPVSAFLHAVAVVKVGVFSILKITLYTAGLDLLAADSLSLPLSWLAVVTILGASLIAMCQKNLKARLAYSTISQLAYITLGAMLANASAFMGGSLQLVAHALAKMTLFMCAGAIYTATKKTKINELDGLGRRMPLTFAAFFIGAVSVVGLPPMGGAWPKFYLLAGALAAEQPVIAVALLISSLLNIWYLLSIPVRAFLTEEKDVWAQRSAVDTGRIKEAPLLCVLPAAATALACVLCFFLIGPLVAFFEKLPL